MLDKQPQDTRRLFSLTSGILSHKPMLGSAVVIMGPLALLASAALGYFVSPVDFAYTWLVEICGITIGSLLGFLASPLIQGEKAAFSVFAKALLAFVSGYLLSKVDPLIIALLNADHLKDAPSVARLLIFVISLLIAFMFVYSYRLYIQFQAQVLGQQAGKNEAGSAAGAGETN